MTAEEQMLKAFPTFGWPESAWHIDARADDAREGLKFTAHAHGPWNPKTKVYGQEKQFGTFAEAVQWLAQELKVKHRFIAQSLPGSDSTCHECGLPAENPIHPTS